MGRGWGRSVGVDRGRVEVGTVEGMEEGWGRGGGGDGRGLEVGMGEGWRWGGK